MSLRLLTVTIGLAFAMSATSADAKYRYKRHHLKAPHSYHHKRHHVRRYASHRRMHYVGRGAHDASADRSCLTAKARELLARIEANFGPVQAISTCRPGAVIAGTNHPSLHRYGMAIDFRTARKAAVVRWLIANNSGGTMTYSNSDHIHADVGRHFVSLAGAHRVARSYRHGQHVATYRPSDGGNASAFAGGDWPIVQVPDQYAGRRYARHARHHGRHEGAL
jgi:uncharacterized protein YcbK (DUF882 family)